MSSSSLRGFVVVGSVVSRVDGGASDCCDATTRTARATRSSPKSSSSSSCSSSSAAALLSIASSLTSSSVETSSISIVADMRVAVTTLRLLHDVNNIAFFKINTVNH